MTPLPRHVVRLDDLSDEEIEDLLDLSSRLKGRTGRGELAGRAVGLLFFKGSLRTRTSLEAAVHQLGGHTIHLASSSDFWELEDMEGAVMDGRAPEHIRDAAAVLSSYVDALAIRTREDGKSWELDRRDAQISAWARHARVPVLNLESAVYHPLQALADLFTMREALGSLGGRRLALVWTHSPDSTSPSVAHSLVLAALRSGMHVTIGHPPGYELDPAVLEEAHALGGKHGAELSAAESIDEAVEGAHVVYARSWFSLSDYGNPTLAASRRARHTAWLVDEAKMARGEDARFMNAMPVRRNLEVTDAVLDGPRSLVYQQAANRLPTQKALISTLLRPGA